MSAELTPLPDSSLGKKIILLGVIAAALMAGVYMVWSLTSSREGTNREVAQSISDQWGGPVSIAGIYVQPNDVAAPRDTAERPRELRPLILPTVQHCRAEVDTRTLHRSIYEAEVFTARVTLTGTFSRAELAAAPAGCTVSLRVPAAQITALGPLVIDGKEVKWTQASGFLRAALDPAAMPEQVQFSTTLTIRGSGELSIRCAGRESTVSIEGAAPNPSFAGDALPADRTVGDGRFSASWQYTAPDTVYAATALPEASTAFLTGVSRYQKVERALKYSFIIIVLTFLSVLVVEIVKKRPIPLLNYLLIGAALIIFYSLLLSFAELVSFGWAYLVAASMTVLLVTLYMWRMLRSCAVGLSIGAVLALLYSCCYVLLVISTYALLLGSLLLFFGLAAMMYASLRIAPMKEE